MSTEDLPEGWTAAPIGSVCQLINGRAFKPCEWVPTGLPIVRIQNLNNPDAPFNHFAGALDSKRRIEHGELLFAWSGTPGTSFGAHIWTGGPAALNQHIYRVLFSEKKLDKRFLRLAINERLEDLIHAAHGGAGLAHVTKPIFEQTEIAFPPLAEQKRIVEKVEALLAQVNAARDRLTRVREILKRFRQSVLAAACSGRLTEQWRDCGGAVDNDGTTGLPTEWRTTCLADVITGFETGRSLNASGQPASGTEIGILKISAVTWGDFRAGENKALPLKHQPRPHEFVRRGDLLITRANTSDLVGAVVLVPEDYPNGHPRVVLPDKILRILSNPRVATPEYLLLALRAADVRAHFADNATGTSDSMRNLSQPKIAAAPIALPPLDEQAQIVRRVEGLFAVADAVERRLAVSAACTEKVPQAILAKAFRGALVPTDPGMTRIGA